jgi:ribosomal protein S27AE
MVKFLSQIYSILFFLSISILTIIIVQTLYTFIQNELHFQTFIVSIIIEIMFVFVIIKVYDELGCKWESIKTIPLLKKNKEYQNTVQNNYYYNNNSNNNSNNLETKTRFCSNCGISITNYKINSNLKNIPKFCTNCGFLFNENFIDGNQQKEWPFHN